MKKFDFASTKEDIASVKAWLVQQPSCDVVSLQWISRNDFWIHNDNVASHSDGIDIGKDMGAL
jgi:hypothetical protein